MSICDVSATWDISKFVRKIEFQYPPTSIVEYVSEAVKLVRMLPRIREVAFVWWIGSTGVEEIARAFAPISHNPSHSLDQTPSSTSTSALSETRTGPASTSDPLKVHLDMVDFESVHMFLDFLESFGGRLRELSLSNVGFGGDDGKGRGDFRGRRLPGIESVCLGFEAVVKPKVPGLDGPTMGNTDGLFGAPDVCDILESIAPNVSELQLFRDVEEAKDVYMYVSPGSRTARTLRLPMFRKLKSVTMCVPGSRWSDLIYEIAAWFARDRSHGEIADPTCQDGRASPPSSVTPFPAIKQPSNASGPVERPEADQGQIRLPRWEKRCRLEEA
ncbi:hypothetical protein BJ322DRAFT_574810 [Thelephora terrestris]|uniref:Uncharacterized protein n=1 Tax=Thelephora terrestris TaxID=56493 RepID=A0A9P6H326_9AGAM|nr:hypothetical protein BJ322DRAFT_574810 [Thelephora terrestris]